MPALDEERRERDAAFDAVVGDTVRTYREQRGLSIRALAECADLAASSVHRIETGERSMKMREAVDIAHTLGISITTLLKDT